MDNDATAANQDDYITVSDYCFSYGANQVLFGINLAVPRNQVTALIGPSGCGKSTLIRNVNRMNELIDGTSHSGDIRIDGSSIYDPSVEVISLRRRVGMIFQKPNPFPKSVLENVAYPLKVIGGRSRSQVEEIVEETLVRAALWDEVKDRLHDSAFSLSGGQMQRLCIARAIANEPEIILMDEPCSALDPIATSRIEDLIDDLKRKYTIVIVTHNMQQAARVADRTAFMLLGELVEVGTTQSIFFNPADRRTEDYISGRFG